MSLRLDAKVYRFLRFLCPYLKPLEPGRPDGGGMNLYHSVDEQREIIIGHSRQNRLLLIAFTERSGNLRIISARLATRNEREDYEQNAL